VELSAEIHREEGAYWANVPEVPGVFAAGDSLEELVESLREGMALSLGVDLPALRVTSAKLSI
jgi:predicted RNase H-like HicB family nuclease